jgi:hypothetical protein
MGLDISGKKTKLAIHWSYGTLHNCLRKAALRYCGMPETIKIVSSKTKYYNCFDFFMFHREGYEYFFNALTNAGYLLIKITGIIDTGKNYLFHARA